MKSDLFSDEVVIDARSHPDPRPFYIYILQRPFLQENNIYLFLNSFIVLNILQILNILPILNALQIAS